MFSILIKLYKEHPEFGRYMFLRSIQRRSYFLKVFEFLRNLLEFRRKRKLMDQDMYQTEKELREFKPP